MGVAARHPFLSLLLVVFVLAVPALVLARRERFVRAYVPFAMGLLIALGLVRAGIYLVRVRPVIEGVDFFNYLCVARDMHHGAHDLSDWRYAYFPGVYTFWRIALTMAGESLGGVQTFYALALGANALLLATAIWRAVRSWLGAAVCAIGYVVLIARLEGAFGVAEPIAMLPVAAAAAIWAGETLRGRRGLWLAAVLGAGIGLGAYVKQQGALQAAGWLALPLTNLLVGREQRHERRAIGLVPAVAAVVFFAGILAEGHGLFPLRMGLKAVATYSADSGFWTNLQSVGHQVSPLLSVVLLVMLAGTIGAWRWPALRSQRWLGLAMFALLAAAAGLYQFTKRGYFHYALLSAPWMLLAIVLIVSTLWSRFERRGRPVWQLAALLACALPFVHINDPASDLFYLWPPDRVATPDLGHWRMQEPVAGDFVQLGKYLHPGEDVLVMPPRHDDIHFLYGTRSVSWEQGYNWGFAPSPAVNALASPTLAAVVVITVRDPTDYWTWAWHKCDDAVKNLERRGFHEVAHLPSMSVWRRR